MCICMACMFTCVGLHVCVCVSVFRTTTDVGSLPEPLSILFVEARSLVDPETHQYH